MTHRPNQLQSAIGTAFDRWAAQHPLVRPTLIQGIPRAEEAQRHPEVWREYLAVCAERGIPSSVSRFVGIVRKWEAEGRVPVASPTRFTVAAETAKIQAETARIQQAMTTRRQAADRALTADLGAAIQRTQRRDRERRRTPQFVRLLGVA